eukprot:COSAG02_NODE_13920_length_1330_cov_1.757108_1_plen_58_part_10
MSQVHAYLVMMRATQARKQSKTRNFDVSPVFCLFALSQRTRLVTTTVGSADHVAPVRV